MHIVVFNNRKGCIGIVVITLRCGRGDPGSIPGYNIIDTVSEWLRRSTRNRLGSARAGSNPVGVVILFL